MRIAITRDVSPAIARCELTHLEREDIDVELAADQHARYVECLATLGCAIRALPAEPRLPDSVFVEDTAVVLEELAVMARPGAESRRPEIATIAPVLGESRRLFSIVAPGTLDGGDVLVLDRHVYVGRSRRTNEEGVRQLRGIVGPMGYEVTPVPVRGCLHLKSAIGRVGPHLVLINRDWVDASLFRDASLIDVDPAEPRAAGALAVGDTVVYPAEFERTRERLGRAGISTATVDLSELAKAEAGVTCCSIVFDS